MKGYTFHNSSAPSSSCTLVKKNKNKNRHYKPNGILDTKKTTSTGLVMVMGNAALMKWRSQYLLGVLRYHPIPCVLALSLFFFMGVEYTIPMIPPSSPPFDLGFVLTLPIRRLLASAPTLNSFLAALNTFLRLLSTRGHYTIDLVVGVGAGILFDSIAGKYEESKKSNENGCSGLKAT